MATGDSGSLTNTNIVLMPGADVPDLNSGDNALHFSGYTSPSLKIPAGYNDIDVDATSSIVNLDLSLVDTAQVHYSSDSKSTIVMSNASLTVSGIQPALPDVIGTNNTLDIEAPMAELGVEVGVDQPYSHISTSQVGLINDSSIKVVGAPQVPGVNETMGTLADFVDISGTGNTLILDNINIKQTITAKPDGLYKDIEVLGDAQTGSLDLGGQGDDVVLNVKSKSHAAITD